MVSPSVKEIKEQWQSLRSSFDSLQNNFDDATNILTNLDHNSDYKTYVSIFSQIHWFNQLRIAEQIIVEKHRILRELFKNVPDDDAWDAIEADFLIPQLKDAILELQTAVNAKNKIVNEHPEIKTLDYQSIQSSIAKIISIPIFRKRIKSVSMHSHF
jgi:hypothetical protein